MGGKKYIYILFNEFFAPKNVPTSCIDKFLSPDAHNKNYLESIRKNLNAK